MKKIVFVCLTLSNGGAERVMSLLANALSEKGYIVEFVILFNSIKDYELDGRIIVHDLKWTKSLNPIKNLRRIKTLRKIIGGDDVVVISFLFRAIAWVSVASLLSKNKCIFSDRNDPSKDPNTRLKRFIRNIAFLLADRIVFQTEEQMNYYIKTIRKKGAIIYNPVKQNLPDYNIDNVKRIVISVCRLEEQKNIKDTIDAFKLFHHKYIDFELHIYGRGSQKEYLKCYIEKNDLADCVFLKDFTQNIHERIIEAMFFVSSSGYEGMSNSILEALAIGIPVICTDCPIGGNRILIKDGYNGIIVEVNDVNQLYNNMKELVENKTLRIKLSGNAKLSREKFSVESIIKKWEKIIAV